MALHTELQIHLHHHSYQMHPIHLIRLSFDQQKIMTISKFNTFYIRIRFSLPTIFVRCIPRESRFFGPL